MKRFILFNGSDYYPDGGWHDFGGDFDSIDEAKAAGKSTHDYVWAHVVDTATGEIVWEDDHK